MKPLDYLVESVLEAFVAEAVGIPSYEVDDGVHGPDHLDQCLAAFVH